ncbi:His-Xaa-Ser system radical SAM maturase HxsB [Breoghania corrubedonensis]|uniref:His-Xaa-Ser system radical SAM maturase HxsB n=1 Tax=Breoghania corrubedonensis TaxID=665038 RepID=A0A2T5VA32_9HYPH|nr:His-Xaa-Ser system radical SAM maturase HxsB [Breoghania corrubedonensis]
MAHTAFAYRWAARQAVPGDLGYVVLVPTLRCNLACSYCQVSRADEKSSGHDWTDQTLEAVFTFLSGISADTLKVEFQGGEPLLRVDLLDRVRTFCRQRFQKVEFVVCTNLQHLGPAEWEFINASDTFVSTSIDGNAVTHRMQRTETEEKNDEFFSNLDEAVRRLAPGRISALPTIDVENPPSPASVLDTYARYGIHSIYLRPINYQGFARKRHAAKNVVDRWNALYREFIDLMIEQNGRGEVFFEEFYLVHCLRRILRSGIDNHVDLRNPNFLGKDYIVIDYDGRFYPTDEARMMTRVGQIDLSVGDVFSGLDNAKLDVLNQHASNTFDPDCIHCPYQAFCGVDLIDDISREGRIDGPRIHSDFCRRHTFLFDLVFELLYSEDPKVRRSLAAWAGVPDLPRSITPVHQ